VNRPTGRIALFAALVCGLLALAVMGLTEASRAAPGDPSTSGSLAVTHPPVSSSYLCTNAVPDRLVDPVSASLLLKRQIWIRPYPKALAIGDFNRDGRKDLAVLNSRPATVSILLGLGNGNFGLRRAFPVPKGANAIAVANLNGGDKQDLIAGVGHSWTSDGLRPGTVSVLLGRGDGTFKASRTYGLGYVEDTLTGVVLAIADLNGDRKPDIVTAEGHKLIILFGRGDGRLRPARAYPVDAASGRGIISLALGRLNGDLTPEAIVGSEWSANEPTGDLSVMLGNGRGGFGAARTEDTRFLLPCGLAVADLNHDGKRDLLVAYNREADVETDEYPAVTVSLGRGDGTFSQAAGYDFGSEGAGALKLADFNGDGNLDLLLTFVPGIHLLLGNGDGSFQPANVLDTTRRPHGVWVVAVADFNNDGRPDFVVEDRAARHLSMFLNTSGSAD